MRIRWRLALPLLGLSLFALISYKSFQRNRVRGFSDSHYFYWSSIRLGPDPLRIEPPPTVPCKDASENCVAWDPDTNWINPGLAARLLVLTALPAFVIGIFIIHALARLGISEVTTFMVSMPFLIFAWYYLVGWLIDRWRSKRSLAVDSRRPTLI